MSNNPRKKLEELFLSNPMESNVGFIPMGEDDIESIDQKDVPMPTSILALRNAVLFPSVVLPITVGREKSIQLVREAYKNKTLIGAVSQKDAKTDDPTPDDIYEIGTLAKILKIFEMPDGGITILLQGIQKISIERIVDEVPYLKADVRVITEKIPETTDEDYNAISGSVKDLVLKVIQHSPHLPQETAFAVRNIENKTFLINFVSAHIEFSEIKSRQDLLQTSDLKERGIKLIELLNKEIQQLEIKNDIQQKVRSEMDQQQREYFLHQQMKTIQSELGGTPIEEEVDRIKKKAKKLKWSKEVETTFKKELARFEKMNPNSGEFSVQLGYLDTLTDLPWGKHSKDNLDLHRATKVLDADHFGMDDIKERIIEYLAVLKLTGTLKSPIICLYGPPGVGKTSLGKSIARALDREYGRISLGGLHDEAEIRGHRRTYIGAMPGRIIQTINRCKTANPVIILDEIDKVGNDFKGDPSSALLEVLDPEQNAAFRDNYLDVDFDLSNVMFITTANRVDTIHSALRDRMEMINIGSYITEEKLEIAKRHLIPKLLENHGLKDKNITIEDAAIIDIIESYTRESGVRGLEKQLAKIIRNKAKGFALEEEVKLNINKDIAREILGVPHGQRDVLEPSDMVGVTAGLAWTEVGGDILFVEASISQGKPALTITGNLGDVMKESATIAMEYLKAHSSKLGLNPEVFENTHMHIHVPEGAIPKDGPSAGVTMITSMASALTGRKVRSDIAMTGEITLRGKVLPVGGIKEKILAAKRAGAKTILLCKKNEKDIKDIKEVYVNGLNFKYVENIEEVWDFALRS